MLHTSIPAYANRNGILARLIALFPLLFTTSSDVLCSKFDRVWEMLWIFKVARWTHDRCMKINIGPTVSNGVSQSFILWDLNCKFGSVAYRGHPNKLTGLHLWRFKLEILQSWLPRRYPQTWHSDADISDLGLLFFYAFIFTRKELKPVGYTRTMYLQTGKNTKWAEIFVWCLLLSFKVAYRDHLTQLLPFTWDFVAKGQRLVWGQVG